MGTFKKDSWKGKEAFENIGMISFLIISFFAMFLGRIISDNFLTGIFIIIGIAFYFLILAHISKSFALRITKSFAGKRRWRCCYDIGRGRTGKIILFAEDKYIIPLEEAPQSIQEKARKTEEIMGDVEIEVNKIERGEIKASALSIIEDSKYKKELALREVRDQEITDKAKEEYILDTLLQPYYEKETKEEAFINGNPTKEFIEWKKTDGKVVKYIQQEIKTQIASIEKNKKQTQKDTLKRRLQLIGEQIAIGWTLNEIIEADEGGAEGGGVHGFLKTHYEDSDELINKHQILDIAQQIAREIWVPKIQKVITRFHLATCIKTVVPLYEEAFFDHEPNFTFKKALVYAQDTFENAVDWKEGVLKTVHNFPDIPVTNGNSDIIIPTRITPNIPMIIIAHSPGKDDISMALQIDEEEVEKEKEKSAQYMIAEKDAEIIELKNKVKVHQEKEIMYRKIAAEITQEMEIIHNSIIEEKMKRLKEKEQFNKTSVGKVALFIIGIVAIILFIVVLINLGRGGISEMTNSTNYSLSLISTFYQNICFLGG